MSTKQQTLKAPISFSGKGLHTGVKVTMTVNPAEAGTGIVFRRTDLEGQPIIPALCDNVVDTSRGTTVEAGGHRVHTIEHIMSALWTLGVDNAVIDIDAPETPIMDGSAREYARAITETGLADQDAERQFYHVTEKMVYTIPEKVLTEPPPKVTMIFLSAGISFASLAMEPLPKINLTGFWKVKLFIRFSFILFVFPTKCRKALFVGLKALFQASYFMPHFRATVCTRTLSDFDVRTCGRGIW